MKILSIISGVLTILAPMLARGEKMSNSDIAAATQNPITMIYSLPIQNNTYFNLGDSSEFKNIANFQPVIPMTLSDDWDIVWRLILPVVTTPTDPVLGSGGNITDFKGGHTTGLGDLTLSAFIAPEKTGKFIWGAGGVGYAPSATDDAMKTKQWGAGPSFVGLTSSGPWTYGTMLMNVWSFGTDKPGDKRIDFMQIQPFVNYNLEDGWFLTSVPIIFAYWDRPSDERWVVPLGGGIGKGLQLGKLPMSVTAQAYYNIVTPEVNGEEWSLRLQAQIFFPRKRK